MPCCMSSSLLYIAYVICAQTFLLFLGTPLPLPRNFATPGIFLTALSSCIHIATQRNVFSIHLLSLDLQSPRQHFFSPGSSAPPPRYRLYLSYSGPNDHMQPRPPEYCANYVLLYVLGPVPRSTPKPPAEGYGEDRRVLPGKPDAIHSGARKVFPPLVGRQQASSRRLGCRTLLLIS